MAGDESETDFDCMSASAQNRHFVDIAKEFLIWAEFMNNWRSVGVSAEGVCFPIQGTNVWSGQWESSGSEIIELPHPEYPAQIHRMRIYIIKAENNAITFAAGELSANVWGFYELVDSRIGNRILKVNHAGENGAIQIYRGQILVCRLFAKHMIQQLREFKSHEERHLKIFETELIKRNQPRCKSFHVCGIGGFALGLITGLLGSKAIAATTIAVEGVVLKHLDEQIKVLKGIDLSTIEAIKSIISEEQSHHDQYSSQMDDGNFWLRFLKPVVALSTETVIWLGMII